MRAMHAMENCHFDSQIMPVVRPDGQTVSYDQGVRMPPDREKMASLKPVFKEDGVVTAGNSSQVSDGAAAVLLASSQAVGRYNLSPMARLVSRYVTASDPVLMLDAPIPATREVLKRAGLTLDDMDVIEINEAFASVVLAWAKGNGRCGYATRKSQRRRDCPRTPIGSDRSGLDDQARTRAPQAQRAVWTADHVHWARNGDCHGDRTPVN